MVDAKGFLYRCFSLDVLVEYSKWSVNLTFEKKQPNLQVVFVKKSGFSS